MNQTLSNPVAVRDRLEEIERDLAMLQNDLEEARYEALRAVGRVLETRANIGMSLLRSQGRA
jgi:hypothetical protein